jgi:hypothetical protein
MPNIWAHIQFGREAAREAAKESALPTFPENPEWMRAFQFGCQGPDFLFYHHFLPWQSSTALNRLGSQMHNVRCGPFLLSLLDEARKTEISSPVFAFAFGFLLHHVLDRNFHPFVFSRSGFRKWDHQRYETAMDAVIMHRRAQLSTAEVPVAPEVDTGGRLPGGFSEAFLAIVRQHYPVLGAQITAAELDEAAADMVRAQRLFFDPAGWKGRLLFGQLEPFSPPRRLPRWDVLNDARKPWVDPTDRTVFHTDSADELWEKALSDARELISALALWLQAANQADADQYRTVLAERIGNRSYETGLDCGVASITFAESVIPPNVRS